jgi:outer membrane lipoprotein SlyB
VATVVGALGGGYVGNRIEKGQTQVSYQIGVKYDDGTWATIRQTAPTGLHIGDRVVVTDNGIQLLGR